MVESSFVNRLGLDSTQRPVGVLRALATGFDRIAAKPYLILPSLILDLFLWFGPHLTIPALIESLTTGLILAPTTDPGLVEQVGAIQEALAIFIDRFNLFSAFSSLPAGMPFNLIFSVFSSLLVGLPSLMAMRMPLETPLGSASVVTLQAPAYVALAWIAMTGVGVGAGVLYNRWLIRQVDPQAKIGSAWLAWARLLLLALIGYVAGSIVLFLSGLIASGQGLVYIGLPILFVASVYLAYTPHGILRYEMNIWQALKQSLWFVRWNFLGAFGYLITAFLILWISTAQVWSLPNEESWFNLLAILGHAFVSATVLAGSYAFFQGRRQWLLARIDEVANAIDQRFSQQVSEEENQEGDKKEA
jgi:hypothetical protein